jgi:hypothetical protein
LGCGEVDKIGLVCAIAKQAFVGWLLSDLWFQRLSGFPVREPSIEFNDGLDHLVLATHIAALLTRRYHTKPPCLTNS